MATTLLGYQKYQEANDQLTGKESEIKVLTAKLTSDKFNRRIENTTVTEIRAEGLTVKDELGKPLSLTVTDASSIQEVVYSADKAYKNYVSAPFSKIKKGALVNVTFNGLGEVVNIAFENK